MKIDRPDVDMAAVRAGDPAALALAVASFASTLFEISGSHISFPCSASFVASLSQPTQACQLAAAMDLCELLKESPHGRAALAAFGREVAGVSDLGQELIDGRRGRSVTPTARPAKR